MSLNEREEIHRGFLTWIMYSHVLDTLRSFCLSVGEWFLHLYINMEKFMLLNVYSLYNRAAGSSGPMMISMSGKAVGSMFMSKKPGNG